MAQPLSPVSALAEAHNETSEACEPVNTTALPCLEAPVETVQDQAARAETLEQLALYHARCEDAASACWYLCRSLGLARQQEPGEPTLDLLFELLGALADLPAEVCASPLPESEAAADTLGIFELCHQLSAAREQTRQAWAELAEMEADEALAHAELHEGRAGELPDEPRSDDPMQPGRGLLH